MQARLWTIVCKFGGDLAICLVEEAICTKCLQTDGQTDRQTDGRTDDGRRTMAQTGLHLRRNELMSGVWVVARG